MRIAQLMWVTLSKKVSWVHPKLQGGFYLLLCRDLAIYLFLYSCTNYTHIVNYRENYLPAVNDLEVPEFYKVCVLGIPHSHNGVDLH